MTAAVTVGAREEGTGEARELEFLTFRVGRESYGIDIHKVQEIRGYEGEGITTIANAPPFIKGVSNLRGTIVPIIDLRIKFGDAEPTYDAFTVVIILSLATRVVGIVVDAVSDVVALRDEEIRPAPAFGALVNTGHVAGIGTRDERMLILIDIEHMMAGADMGLAATA